MLCVMIITLPTHRCISQDGSALTGEQVTFEAKTIQDGGISLNPIPGDFLRTIHDTPQV